MSELLESLAASLDVPFVASILRVLLIILITGLLLRITTRVGAKVNREVAEHARLLSTKGVKRSRTMGNVIRYTLNTLIVVVALVTILHETGVDIKPVLAGAGVAGIVIGLSTQNLMRDSLAGFFVLVEHQYDVGDVISIAGVTGTVEKVTLRMTQLRDTDGIVHFVPNGQAAVVANLTREGARAKLDVNIGYGEDVERVIEVLNEVGGEMEEDPEWHPYVLEPMEVLGVQSLEESSVQVRVSIKTQPNQRWSVARELRLRIKTRFDLEGIEMPFPQRTIHLSSSGSGSLPLEQAPSEATR